MTTPTPTPFPPALVHDGNYRVSIMDSVADLKAPTVTELEAGLDVAGQLTMEGINREASDERVDDSRLASTYTTQKMGRTGFSDFALTFVRVDINAASGTTADEAYDQLRKGTHKYVAIRDTKAWDEPWAEGDVLEVYPVECGTRSKAAPAANENQRFTVPMAVTSPPELYAAVPTAA